jgi:hypothetical protein
MHYYQSALFVAFSAGLYALILSLGLKNKLVRAMVFSIVLLCLLRFISLFIFYSASSQEILYLLKYPALSSIVGLPLLSYICIRYLKNNCLRNLDIIVEGFIALTFLCILFNAPKGIIIKNANYSILFNNGWQLIIAVSVCIFSAIMLYIALLYFTKVKNLAIKLNLLLFFIGFIICIVEYVFLILGYELLKENIIAEMILMLAILFSIRNMIRIE